MSLTLVCPAQILDTNPQLYFHLQQQHLIELIRANNITAALDFAKDELAPRGEENVCATCRNESTARTLCLAMGRASSCVMWWL